jgi:hypothetical protein
VGNADHQLRPAGTLTLLRTLVPSNVEVTDEGVRSLSPLMILVAGPYRSGTNDDPALIARNVAAMTEVALELFRAGHLPVMGEWYALPLIRPPAHPESAIRCSMRSFIQSPVAWSPSAMAASASAAHPLAPTRWSALPGSKARPCTSRRRRYQALRKARGRIAGSPLC